MATSQPAAASLCAMARPMPRDAPVTIAIFPARASDIARVLRRPHRSVTGRQSRAGGPRASLCVVLFARADGSQPEVTGNRIQTVGERRCHSPAVALGMAPLVEARDPNSWFQASQAVGRCAPKGRPHLAGESGCRPQRCREPRLHLASSHLVVFTPRTKTTVANT